MNMIDFSSVLLLIESYPVVFGIAFVFFMLPIVLASMLIFKIGAMGFKKDIYNYEQLI
jgi:hypothetical protein